MVKVKEQRLGPLGPSAPVQADLIIRTPDRDSGPWELQCKFTIEPFVSPRIAYFLQYRLGGISWNSRWYLLEDTLDKISKEILEAYVKKSIPRPPRENLKGFLCQSRRSLIEAHLAAVARQFSSELSSEDVMRIWGMEDVKMVMES